MTARRLVGLLPWIRHRYRWTAFHGHGLSLSDRASEVTSFTSLRPSLPP